MKKLIKGLFVAAGLLLTTQVVNAQQKFGHLNSDEIFSVMPEAKTVSTTIENLAKSKQGEIDKMIAEYQAKYKAAQEKEKTLSEANKAVVLKELETAQGELQDLQKRIEDARTKADKDLRDKQAELYPPLQQKVAAAINSISKEKGLAYVFDTAASQGFNNLVYFDGGEDLTAAVKAKLGISATAAPAANKPATGPAKKP
ncbi:OmpH family outer membrane protein [Pedobacter chitinilyticus]|uniref:OmpH family outer membrane protein n=1 Tax=Pedobacter chitinilyticus TaxID=2233776 RepID=A0A443YMH3_9SPHI|nr:OmpH family outer membrane protein [Pedobacter chitinilyticus]RWU04957.1 OmpH family outer membrane protein [Pedobacter chitinilyticus]